MGARARGSPRSFEAAVSELREALARLSPSIAALHSALRRIPGGEALQEASIATSAVDRNLGAVLAEGRRLWERNYHYALVRRRYTLDEIVARVRRNLQELL